MPGTADIPASSLLGHALDDAIRARETTISVLRRQNAQLLAIVFALLVIVAACACTTFSLVVRNNLVILPDRAKKPDVPARTSAIFDASRGRETAGLETWCYETPAGGAVLWMRCVARWV